MRIGGTTTRSTAGSRGVVLMAVLVVVAIAAMVGTTVLFIADAEVATTRTTIRATQSRASAWSAVQMTMAELLAQRDGLLDGVRPSLSREFAVSAGESGLRATARLVEVVPGETAVPEAGKLDINSATAEMLIAAGHIDEALAGRIVAAAASRPLASVEELLGIEGVTPEMVYGGAATDSASPGESSAPAGDTQGPKGGTGPMRLGDVLTAYAFDPNIQAGVGDHGADHRGKKRINIATEWSDALGRAVSNRFGKDAAKVLEQVMKGGTKFAAPSDLVAILRRLNVAPAEWGPILDSFTTTDDDFLIGRVDLSTATATVLACVPGINADAAAEIVRERDRLGAEARRSVVWPMVNGILKEEQFQTAVDHLTTRCMQWRIRVEAGYLEGAREAENPVSVDRKGGAKGQTKRGSASTTAGNDLHDEEVKLTDRVVYEAVIDVSSRRPRVAYLRNVTMLPGAYSMYQAAVARQPAVEAAPPAAPDAATMTEAAATSKGMKINADLKFSPLDLSVGGEKSRQAGRGADPTVPGDSLVTSGGSDNTGSGGAAASASKAAGTPSAGSADRRIGRWTTGVRGGGGT